MGGPGGAGGMGGGAGAGAGGYYQFHGDPFQTFKMFFGDEDPFGGMFGMGGMGGGGGGTRMFFGGGGHGFDGGDFDGGSGMYQPHGRRKQQDPAVVRDLPVALEDIYNGASKRMKIKRTIYSQSGSSRQEDEIVEIDIKKGWKAGTKITFPKKGDQRPGAYAADVVFVIKDKPHPVFTRDGSDIKYKAPVTLKQALLGADLQIPTLKGESVLLRMSDVIKPGTIRRIPGYGLPLPKDPSNYGDIIVEFEIMFPDKLSTQAKEALAKVLP